MEMLDILRARRSVRQYQENPVPDSQLQMVLEAARLAPSWKNSQCWHYIVLQDIDRIQQLKQLTGGNPRGNAYESGACFLIICADPAVSGNMDGKPYYMTDAAISLQQAMLMAESLGLATCWVGAVSEQPIKEFLGIPDPWRIIGLTPLGYPAESPMPRGRQTMADMVSWGQWGGKK